MVVRSYCRNCQELCGIPGNEGQKEPKQESKRQQQRQREDGNDDIVVNEEQDTKNGNNNNNDECCCCAICLGLFSKAFQSRLESALKECMEPYNNNNNNRFSRKLCPPMIALPGDLIQRFRHAHKEEHRNDDTNNNNGTTTPDTDFARALKQHSQTVLLECLDRLEQQQPQSPNNNINDPQQQKQPCYPSFVDEEELGYLGVHVIVVPASHIPRPRPASSSSNSGDGPQQRQRNKRNFGNAFDGPKQGGDPRQNHEARFLAEKKKNNNNNDNTTAIPNSLWTVNQALAEAYRVVGTTWWDQDIVTTNGLPPALEISVAIWRRSFYLGGCYTKTRRDVSQTPFFVTNDDHDDDDVDVDDYNETTATNNNNSNNHNHKRQRRLGVTSVAEQILPSIEQACNGISTRNNNNNNNTNNNHCGGGGGGVLYGMAKFHASGREDMNVRMIVPSSIQLHHEEEVEGTTPTNNSNNNDTTTTTKHKKVKITGRPFVCEIIDALHMPLPSALPKIAADINCDNTTTTTLLDTTPHQRTSSSSTTSYSYGRNPFGVGIDPNHFEFVSSVAFGTLQEQTESKVKYYGCLCWCANGGLPVGKNNNNDHRALNLLLFQHEEGLKEPLELQQRTPLRVLHRRSNIIRSRFVRTCRATCVDEYHFQLHLSTDAGTYVKEFVHGDLGRTVPSIASLLGCKTDILELDCEGIQMDD